MKTNRIRTQAASFLGAAVLLLQISLALAAGPQGWEKLSNLRSHLHKMDNRRDRARSSGNNAATRRSGTKH
jgi:hypothetical protein